MVPRLARVEHERLLVMFQRLVVLPALLVKLAEHLEEIVPEHLVRIAGKLLEYRNRLRLAVVRDQRADVFFPQVLRGLVTGRLVQLHRALVEFERLLVAPREHEEVAGLREHRRIAGLCLHRLAKRRLHLPQFIRRRGAVIGEERLPQVSPEIEPEGVVLRRALERPVQQLAGFLFVAGLLVQFVNGRPRGEMFRRDLHRFVRHLHREIRFVQMPRVDLREIDLCLRF
ncbi:MAG: hypothetical protein ABMA01_20075, partial [Chthoniobacteraceae bacterium]